MANCPYPNGQYEKALGVFFDKHPLPAVRQSRRYINLTMKRPQWSKPIIGRFLKRKPLCLLISAEKLIQISCDPKLVPMRNGLTMSLDDSHFQGRKQVLK
ncbi:hypothetical protein CDAR_203421 [Caerostris darwini]|uniref:Uncharacterized protein n=1 Tax=Caerostris darwini TaxID=1538125 RepID=A0AAV4Q8H2_9ARAC|nr:hypothetical protein CDAR_203141 [Caerostris darwini]GIY05326.1 hypothetical protein CDAR_203421 [Caerostris darwini]